MPRKPKKPKPETPKRILPDILKTPITFELGEGVLATVDNEHGVQFLISIIDQIQKRLDAVFTYYGIQPPPDAALIELVSGDSALTKLIWRMASELFPRGFRAVRADKKIAGRGKERSIADQIDLWVEMQSTLGSGTTYKQAATYIKDNRPDLAKGNSVSSIKTRLSEAKKLNERITKGEMTETELLILFAHDHGIDL